VEEGPPSSLVFPLDSHLSSFSLRPLSQMRLLTILLLTRLDYSARQLASFTPDSLDEEPKEEVYRQLKAVCSMCLTHQHIEHDIMSSSAYSALRKAVYSNDKYVRVLALRSLASLSRHSRDVRRRVAQTMDFSRLAGEIHANESAKLFFERDGDHTATLVRKYLGVARLEYQKDVLESDLDEMLAYAFDDIVSSVTFHIESHPKLLQMDYPEHAAKMLKSPCFHVRTTAMRAISGLTRTIEGRQALAKTDVFPTMYNLVYSPEKRDILLKPESVNFGKFALQQLLLSESALDIMLPRYEKFFLAMTKDAKEDLLMRFDLQDDTDYDKGLAVGKQFGIGFAFGAVWGALRSLLQSEWVAGLKKPQVRLNTLKNIAVGALNGSTGTIPIVALYILIVQLNDQFLVRFQDTPATHFMSSLAAFGTIAAIAGVSLQIFPYGLLPAFIGINANYVLTAIPGTMENEQAAARITLKDTPDSDQE